MKNKLYRFKEYKMLLEADRNEDDDNNDFSLPDESEYNDKDLLGTEDEDLDNEEDSSMEDGDDEEEEVVKKVFNEKPKYYIEEALKSVKRKLESLFEKPKPNKDGRTEVDPNSFYDQGVEILDIKMTDMDMNKTLIMKYHDGEFLYHLLISINIQQGIPEKPDVEMDYTMVKECGVKFKKYDANHDLIGQLDRQSVSIKDIDKDFIDILNSELDEKYSVDNNFEIEFKDED